MEPLAVFCHPRVIEEQPRLIAHYRELAFLSRRGLALLAGDKACRLERDTKSDRFDRSTVSRVVVAINDLLCSLINLEAHLSPEWLPRFSYTAIQAAHRRNRRCSVDFAARVAVRTILVNHLHKEIVHVVHRDGWSQTYSEALHAAIIDQMAEIRVVRLRNGYHVLFASDPDVSLRDPDNLPLFAIEVHAGAVSAGALERLGAAMKSFDNDRDLNPQLKTVYVVRCITPELRKRVTENPPFDHTFGLAELLADDRTQRKFANLIVRTVIDKDRK
jgi:hypothetical protein